MTQTEKAIAAFQALMTEAKKAHEAELAQAAWEKI